MTGGGRRETAVAAVLFVAAAAYFVLAKLHGPSPLALNDVYAQFLPNMLHALRALADGGKGLLWNPFQMCGAPFFANSVTGLLYPPHWLFLVLEPNAAVHAVLIVNMVLGALGMLLLARELGLGWVAAVGGALAFELGDPMAQLTGWSPMHDGPWAWVPWAMLCCERALRVPTPRRVLALAGVLALQLLPGFILISALTYQLVGLRAGWEVLTRRDGRAWRAAGAVAVALAVAPLLVAVQLVPGVELARQSARALVSEADIIRDNHASLAQIRQYTSFRQPPIPFLVAPLILAAVAPFSRRWRRVGLFLLAVGVLYAVLGLEHVTPLFGLYIAIPPGMALLRVPIRLFWVCGFCVALLTAVGIETLGGTAGERSLRRSAGPIVAVLVVAGLLALVPGGLRPPETVALAAAVAALLLTSARPDMRSVAAWVAVVAVALNVTAVSVRWDRSRLLSSIEPYWRHAGTFARLQPTLTPQGRVLLVPDTGAALRYTLIQKTSTLLRVPGLYDFEHFLGERLGRYVAVMRHGATFSGLTEVYLPFPLLTPVLRRRLLDAASVRYVVVSRSIEDAGRLLAMPRVPTDDPALDVYSNDRALPRARYVPRVEVIPDADALLQRLADGNDDLATVALVESTPPSGFTGSNGPGDGGDARFVTNDPERLEIEVDAPQRGFLVLADQYAAGWVARVDGAPAPILRANYLFRLVEVPAGRSRVEFRYRPGSVLLGALVSGVTLLAASIVLVRGRRRRR